MKTLDILQDLADAIENDTYKVENGEADASALYFALHQIGKMASAQLKHDAIVEALKHEIDRAGKGYEFGVNGYGFILAHSVRTTYAPVLSAELEAMKALVKDAEKASQECAKKGKPGAIVMSNDGEPFEVMPAEFKSASDVFTLKVIA